MRSSITTRMQRLTFLAFSICAALIPCPQATAQQVTSRKPFFQRDHVCLLEVVGVRQTREIGKGLYKTQGYSVTVQLKSCLPFDGAAEKQQTVEIAHRASMHSRAQDWFPIEQGKHVLVAFDGPLLRSADNMVYVSADNRETSEAWNDCVSFFKAIDGPERERARELAKQLQEQKERLGRLFFRLIDAYDRHVMDDTSFSISAADYLRNKRVPLDSRLWIVAELRHEVNRDREAHHRLVSALIDMVKEIKESKENAPALGNQLVTLSNQFVSRKKAEDLPKVEVAVRDELLSLARNKQIVHQQTQIVPLVNWLEGREIGPTPPASIEEVNVDGKGAHQQTALNGTKTVPAPPVKGEVKQETEGPAQGKSDKWQLSMFALWAVIAALTISLFALGCWRRKVAGFHSARGSD